MPDLVSAGIILILAEPLDSLTTRLDVGDLEVYWTMCSHTLVRIAETVDVSAREYAAALDSLKERVSAQRKSELYSFSHRPPHDSESIILHVY